MEKFLFTVKCSEWLHGEGGEVSCLLRARDGKKCCLGFLALALGESEEKIIGISNFDYFKPNQLINNLKLHEKYKENISKIIITNDKEYMKEDLSRKLLEKLFDELDIKINFVD